MRVLESNKIITTQAASRCGEEWAEFGKPHGEGNELSTQKLDRLDGRNRQHRWE